MDEKKAVDTCPVCGGYAVSLGCLGSTTWFRCRWCGNEYRYACHPEYAPANPRIVQLDFGFKIRGEERDDLAKSGSPRPR